MANSEIARTSNATMIFSPLNPKPKKGLQNQYSSKQTSAFEEEEDSSSSEEIRHSTAKNLGNSGKRFHEACRFQRSCQAEVITGDLDFICTRKHDLFSSERVPKGSTKPWVLIKLPAPTSDVTHCTADQHKARERIRPATSSCCIRSDKNTLLRSSGLCSYKWQGYRLQQSPVTFLHSQAH